jgi:hypothetical protein
MCYAYENDEPAHTIEVQWYRLDQRQTDERQREAYRQQASREFRHEPFAGTGTNKRVL